MSAALQPGRVYRTRELRSFSANPTRWIKSMVGRGEVREAAHGLYYRPRQTFFGPCAPTDAALLSAFLGGGRFLITGSPLWNALDLGTTQHLSCTLVYNGQRTGDFRLDGRPFRLRRVRFPEAPGREWFTVDLLNNATQSGEDPARIEAELHRALLAGRMDTHRLTEMARAYGTPETRLRVARVAGMK